MDAGCLVHTAGQRARSGVERAVVVGMVSVLNDSTCRSSRPPAANVRHTPSVSRGERPSPASRTITARPSGRPRFTCSPRVRHDAATASIPTRGNPIRHWSSETHTDALAELGVLGSRCEEVIARPVHPASQIDGHAVLPSLGPPLPWRAAEGRLPTASSLAPPHPSCNRAGCASPQRTALWVWPASRTDAGGARQAP